MQKISNKLISHHKNFELTEGKDKINTYFTLCRYYENLVNKNEISKSDAAMHLIKNFNENDLNSNLEKINSLLNVIEANDPNIDINHKWQEFIDVMKLPS